MTTRPLTQRQAQCLEIIRRSISARGYPPTIREIGEQMEIASTNGVNDHLRALERKGYLSKTDMKARGLSVARWSPEWEANFESKVPAELENVLLRELLRRVLADAQRIPEPHRTPLEPVLMEIRSAVYRKGGVRPRVPHVEPVKVRCVECGAPQSIDLYSDKPLRAQLQDASCMYCTTTGSLERAS